MGTLELLEAARICPSVQVIVVITSDKCYENRGLARGYHEHDPLGGHDPYSSSKAATEIACSAFRRSFFSPERHREHGKTLVTARAGNVVGGGDWAANRLVPDAVRAFTQDRPVLVRRPNATRPWQHVVEPLRGYLLLAQEAGKRGPSVGESYNFGPRETDSAPVHVVMDLLVAAWGKGARWQADDRENEYPHEAATLQLECSLAASHLGWLPQSDLTQALDDTVRWYRAFHDGSPASGLRDLTVQQIRKLGMR